MQDLSIAAFWAIISEMLGAAFWPLVLLVAAVAVLDFIGLVRGPRRVGKRFWQVALAIGAAAGLAAALSAPALTGSSLGQVETPTDWLFLGLIWLAVTLAVSLALVALLSLRKLNQT